VLPVTQGMKAFELLEKVQQKQRLPLYTNEYQFKVSEKDRARLSLLTRVLDMNTDVHALGVGNLELCRRKYADEPAGMEGEDDSAAASAAEGEDPAIPGADEPESPPWEARRTGRNPVKAGGGANGGVTGLDGLRKDRSTKQRQQDQQQAQQAPAGNKKKDRVKVAEEQKHVNPDNFLFNDITAAKYEEWDVIKTNKWGKRQKRVMGIDYHKIYNKQRKDSKKGPLSHAVKRAERLIADVLDIQPLKDKPAGFYIVYREHSTSGVDSETAMLQYEAEDGPTAAATIIAKILYLRKKNQPIL